MHRPFATLGPALAFLLLAAPAPAQTADPAPLSVAVLDRPPFAMRDAAGLHTGIAVDLLRLAADDMGMALRLEPADDALTALNAGADVVLPVEASPALEAAASLTHPIYSATLGVASERESRVLSVLTRLASWDFLRLLLSLSLLLLGVGAVVWALERRKNGEMFSESASKGLGDGFWWAGVTLTTIGYGDKAPVTALGRAVAMLWMLMGLAVSAALTATIVTLAGTGAGSLTLPEDLQGRSIAVVEGSAAAAYADRQGLAFVLYDGPEAAVAAVEEGRADAALGAAPSLRREAERTKLALTTTRLDPVLIAFALPEGSALLEPLNVALLRVMASEAGRETVLRYLPDG
ncbi:ion channel [Jannaschia sp. W003]|uniref:ion channel n=1 Tax=Jannaschia sp. W003 TaxID=2867012 RepID=UPI0021A8F756|nr:transporter substrate-binding domain-containing protein [Jannaschia sp. W003]UWQ22767.1 transporter substrate-binding domain-containing protein [Jannaschia sp. W003]